MIRNPEAHVRRPAGLVAMSLFALLATGCYQRIAVDKFPPGSLHVRYVPAMDYTDCLAASAVMCANYVTTSEQFTAPKLREDLSSAGLDHTRIADVRDWLAQHRLTLQPLTGSFSDAELTGLGWWLCRGGYPVICVMNKNGGNADYNHAVVVIGVAGGGSVETAEAMHYLDPASAKRLETASPLLFQHFWNSAGNIMLPLFETPQEVADSSPLKKGTVSEPN